METNLNSSVKVAKDVKIQLDHFDGTNYTRWIDKMMFLFISIKIYYIFFYPNLSALPEPQEDESIVVKIKRLKHEEDEVLCWRHILNTSTSRLYDIFSKLKSTK